MRLSRSSHWQPKDAARVPAVRARKGRKRVKKPGGTGIGCRLEEDRPRRRTQRVIAAHRRPAAAGLSATTPVARHAAMAQGSLSYRKREEHNVHCIV